MRVGRGGKGGTDDQRSKEKRKILKLFILNKRKEFMAGWLYKHIFKGHKYI